MLLNDCIGKGRDRMRIECHELLIGRALSCTNSIDFVSLCDYHAYIGYLLFYEYKTREKLSEHLSML